MKHTSNLNNNKQNAITHIEEVKYLTMLCNEKADLVIKTEFGIGHYKFLKFTEIKGNLVLEFNLMDDNKFHDTASIYNHIGKTCFLTAEQYLSVYSYLAEA
tara:strand:+ start:2059 stop:2361 length:303 start_codon:yes stop_codon:yes gene_type:complete